MCMSGGEIKIVATESFAGFNNCLIDSIALNAIYGLLTNGEMNLIIDVAQKEIEKNTFVVMEDASLLLTKNNYNDLFPSADFFKGIVDPTECSFLSKKAEDVDEIIHLKIKTVNNVKFRFFLLLSLAIAIQTKGIISTISFSSFNENFKNEIGLYTSEQWSKKIPLI